MSTSRQSNTPTKRKRHQAFELQPSPPVSNKRHALSTAQVQQELRTSVFPPQPTQAHEPMLSNHQIQKNMLQLFKVNLRQDILQAVTRQIATNQQSLQALQTDRLQDLAIFSQIENQYQRLQSGQQCQQEIQQLTQLLEKNWQQQDAQKIVHEYANRAIVDLMTQSAEEKITASLSQEIKRLTLQMIETILQQEKNENHRNKLRKNLNSLTTPELQVHTLTPIIQNDRASPQPPPIPQNLLPAQLDRKNLTDILVRGIVKCGLRPVNTMASPVLVNNNLQDYSQGVLLERINDYLRTQNKEQIPMRGHCHGIEIFKLLMGSWGLGDVYKEMVTVIASCPREPRDLIKIGNLIKLYLKLIDFAQDPSKYNNTCSRYDLDVLMGYASMSFSFSGYFSKSELAQELYKHLSLTTESRIIISGFGIHKEMQIYGGHTVSIYPENGYFKFSDSNNTSVIDKTVFSTTDMADAIWERIFSIYDGDPKPEIIVSAVRPTPKPGWMTGLVSAGSFFNQNTTLVERIVGVPVREINNKTHSPAP